MLSIECGQKLNETVVFDSAQSSAHPLTVDTVDSLLLTGFTRI